MIIFNSLVAGALFSCAYDSFHDRRWRWFAANIVVGGLNLYIALNAYRELGI